MKTIPFLIIIFLIFLCTEQVGAINRGLINCGNSCYMNATTQCISHVTPLSEYLKKNESAFIYDTENDGAREYTDLLKELQVSTEEQVLSEGPLDINTEANNFHDIIINRIANWWGLFEQQDAPEYLEYFLNYLIDKDPHHDFVKKLFSTQLNTKVICAESHISEHTPSPDFILRVPIPKELNPSIESCIEKYFEQEQLIGDNQYQCDTCAIDNWRKKENIEATTHISLEDVPFEKRNNLINAIKHVSIKEAPSYLIVAVNRFQTSYQIDEIGAFKEDENVDPIMITEKNLTPVSFNQELILPKNIFLSQPIEEVKYNLFGFVVHQGPYGGGHYWAYAKDSTSHMWRKFDDETVYDAEQLVQTIAAAGIEKFDIYNGSESEEESPSEWDGTPYIFFYKRDNLPAELNDYVIPTFEDPFAKKLRLLKNKLMKLKTRLTALKNKLEKLKQKLST